MCKKEKGLLLRAWFRSLGTRVMACFLNANYFVIIVARYWSLSQQGRLQPHSKPKAWQLSTQLKNGLLGGLA